MIIEHLTYDALEDRFDSAIFTENQTKQDLANAGGKLKKHIYDYVVTDSKVERDFVTELDTSEEVAVYAKLPRGFFIPTPVGDYNPDWAIAFTEGSVKHVYFVAETKGLPVDDAAQGSRGGQDRMCADVLRVPQREERARRQVRRRHRLHRAHAAGHCQVVRLTDGRLGTVYTGGRVGGTYVREGD